MGRMSEADLGASRIFRRCRFSLLSFSAPAGRAHSFLPSAGLWVTVHLSQPGGGGERPTESGCLPLLPASTVRAVVSSSPASRSLFVRCSQSFMPSLKKDRASSSTQLPLNTAINPERDVNCVSHDIVCTLTRPCC